jgi:hypothetical protein
VVVVVVVLLASRGNDCHPESLEAMTCGGRKRSPRERSGASHCLVQEGIGLAGGPVKTMYLTDPDGVRVEVMSGTPDLGAL